MSTANRLKNWKFWSWSKISLLSRIVPLHLTPRLRMSRARRPRPYTPAMCVTEWNTKTVLSKFQTVHTTRQHFAVQRSPSSERALLFGRFAGFVLLSFWWEQHVDVDECGALVEWYWQGKLKCWERNIIQREWWMNEWVWSNGGMILTGETEVLGEKHYRAWVVDGWVWSNGGMILTRENWSAGRKIL